VGRISERDEREEDKFYVNRDQGQTRTKAATEGPSPENFISSLRDSRNARFALIARRTIAEIAVRSFRKNRDIKIPERGFQQNSNKLAPTRSKEDESHCRAPWDCHNESDRSRVSWNCMIRIPCGIPSPMRATSHRENHERGFMIASGTSRWVNPEDYRRWMNSSRQRKRERKERIVPKVGECAGMIMITSYRSRACFLGMNASDPPNLAGMPWFARK